MFYKIFNFKFNIVKSFLLIFLINLILFCMYYGKLGMFFIDVSREVYLPTQINNGELLYKDIFNIFTPLGYQLNAFLIKIFGENLNTFYCIGFINSTMILCGIFIILRHFLKGTEKASNISFLTILLIIASCIYSVSLTNYIFPYSYSLIFALNTIIWAIASLLYFLNKEKVIFLYTASFLYGLSIAFKYDYIFFGIVLFLTIILSKLKTKEKIINLLLIIIPLLLSFLELIVKGVNILEIKQAFDYMVGISKSASNTFLYKYLGFIPTFTNLKTTIINSFHTISILTIYGFLLNKINFKEENKKILNTMFLLLALILPFIFLIPIFITSNAFYFNGIGIFLLIILVFLCKIFIEKKKNNNLKMSDTNYFIFYIIVILISAKSIFNISFNSYGTYYFPLIFICILIFILKYLNFIKRNTIIYTLLILSCLYLFSNYERTQITHPCTLNFEKGKISVSKEFCKPITDTYKYIEENTKKEDKILVLPEGAIINFLTNRKSNNMFYQSIPPNIEALNEDFIVQKLKKDLPDYLILQPMSFNNFNETYFCESFGKKICNLIPQYYERPIVFGNDFWIAIYKKKDKKN